MSIHRVKIPVRHTIYQDLLEITRQLNAGVKDNLAKPLGENLTQLTCDVLDQVFAELIRAQAVKDPSYGGTGESNKVLRHITEQLEKYMPKSIGMLSNDRVLPVANYIVSQFDQQTSSETYLCYAVSTKLMQQAQLRYQRLMDGDDQAISALFGDVIDIIDQGVTALIREPKSMLKFNRIMDKSLSGLILLMTSMGYKRIEKISTSIALQQAQDYAKHFNLFMGIEDLA